MECHINPNIFLQLIWTKIIRQVFLKASMYYLQWMFLKYKNKVWKMINCDKMWVAAHSIHKYMKYWEENASLQRTHRRWCHLNNVQKDIKPSNILGIHIW